MICLSLTHFLADFLVGFLLAFGAALAMALVLGALAFLTFGLAAALALGLAGDFAAFAGDFAGLAGDLALGVFGLVALAAGLAGEAGAATTGAGAATTGAALATLALVTFLATTLAAFALGAVLDYVMIGNTCDRAVLLAIELTIYANCANLLFIIPELKALILIGSFCDGVILPLFLWIFPSLPFRLASYHSNIIFICVDHMPTSFILPFLLRSQRNLGLLKTSRSALFCVLRCEGDVRLHWD